MNYRDKTVFVLAILLLCGGHAACPAPDPMATDLSFHEAGGGDGGALCKGNWAIPDIKADDPSCKAAAEDYVPGATTDPYDACLSDDGTYHRFSVSIGSVGRVAGFEAISKLVWRADGTRPTAKDFTDARVIYSEAQGLQSRVERREDMHVAAAAKKCADMDEVEIAAHGDRCVGPAKLQPILNAAFLGGSKGEDVLVNASRIEAGLIWFLYTSVYKEATTCTEKAKDCDSSYAYWSGGEAEGAGLGLSRYLRSVSSQAAKAMWRGVLALRCWRDLDGASPATNLTLRDKALRQMDRAMLRGIAVLIRARLEVFSHETCKEAKDALWAGIQILGGVLDREARIRDATQALTLASELAKDGEHVDAKTIDRVLGALFPCP